MFVHSRSNWNLEVLVFEERGKPLGARKRTNNKLNPHMTPGPGVEPGPHWWEVSALTTASSLLPCFSLDPSIFLLFSLPMLFAAEMRECMKSSL